MNAQTLKLQFNGPAGTLEALRDTPTDAPARGVVVVAHPHPLFGGSMDNKVVQTLARAFVQCGWDAVRFNFRGVGASAGTHDEGRGELHHLVVHGAAKQRVWVRHHHHATGWRVGGRIAQGFQRAGGAVELQLQGLGIHLDMLLYL